MRKLLTICVLSVLCSAASARDEQKVYSWTDEEGNVYYGDSIPAEYAERPKRVLNDQGVSVDQLEGKKTAEQLAEEKREEERRIAEELSHRADQALLATYLSVPEIEMHRDRRVELFQAQAKVTELYLKNLERRLTSIRNEAANFKPYSDDPDAPMISEDLSEDLRRTKETIERHRRNLKRYELEEQEIFERFNDDIERFKILKGISEPPMAAASSGS